LVLVKAAKRSAQAGTHASKTFFSVVGLHSKLAWGRPALADVPPAHQQTAARVCLGGPGLLPFSRHSKLVFKPGPADIHSSASVAQIWGYAGRCGSQILPGKKVVRVLLCWVWMLLRTPRINLWQLTQLLCMKR